MPHVDPVARAEYHRRYSRQHYQENKGNYRKSAIAANKRYRAKTKAFVLAYLLEHPCIDCGEGDPIVLEFDHREGTEKKFNIADLARRGCSLPALLLEIAKCDVRCANCHRRVTYRRRGGVHKGKIGQSSVFVLSSLGIGEPKAL